MSEPRSDGQQPSRVWWLSPAGGGLLITLPTLALASTFTDREFRTNWRSPRVASNADLQLFAIAAFSLALGALIAEGVARRRGSSPPVRPLQLDRLRRAALMLYRVTLLGYVSFLVSGIMNGLQLSDITAAVASDGVLSGRLKRIFAPIPILTTLTQVGVAYAVVGSIVIIRTRDRSETKRLAVIIALATGRAFLLAERLAVVELVVPIVAVAANYGALHHRLRMRRAVQLVPIVAIPLVLMMFTAFEYSRSWMWYRQHRDVSLVDFGVQRLAGYYVTAYNNGAIQLHYLDERQNLPYGSINAVWSFPVIEQAHMYQRLTGLNDDEAIKTAMGAYGSIEFNSPCGICTPLVDFGVPWGYVFLLLFGFVAGVGYLGFAQRSPVWLLVYPVFVVGLFELPRYLYVAQGRTTPGLVALVLTARYASMPATPNLGVGAGRGRLIAFR